MRMPMASLNSLMPDRVISRQMNIESIGSRRVHCVSEMMMPESSAATEPSMSLMTRAKDK